MALNFHPLVKGVLQDDKNGESNEYLMTPIWRRALKEKTIWNSEMLIDLYSIVFIMDDFFSKWPVSFFLLIE